MTIPFVLERRTDGPPQTTNDFLRLPQEPRAAMRKLRKDHATVAEWRKWASWQPDVLGWVRVAGPVEVEIYALRKRGGRIDCGAPYLLAKAMIDGLTDAEFLPGDHSEVVRKEINAGPLVLGYYGIRLVIREIEGITLDMDVPRSTGRTRPGGGRTRTVHSSAGGITLSGGSPLVDGNVGG